MIRGLLQDNQFPGTSAGTRVTAAPGPAPACRPQDSCERDCKWLPPQPNKYRAAARETWLLEVATRSVGLLWVNPQRQCVLAGESWELGHEEAWLRQSPIYLESWAVREDRPFLVCSSRIEQKEFHRKKKWKKETLRSSLWNSPAEATPSSSPHTCTALHHWCGKAPRRVRTVSTLEGPRAHIPSTRESAHHRKPCPCTSTPEESMDPNLWDQRLLGNWAGGWPSAAEKWRRAKLSPSQLAEAKKTTKTVLTSFKPAGGFFF